MIDSTKDLIDSFTYLKQFRDEWIKVTTHLKESGYDLSRIEIVYNPDCNKKDR